MVHDGHPYCEKDYLRKFGQKCMGCGEYMSGEFLNALGGDWHKDCFVCTVSLPYSVRCCCLHCPYTMPCVGMQRAI